MFSLFIRAMFRACILVFPFHVIYSAVLNGKKKRTSAKETAISRGHVVTAFLQKTSLPVTIPKHGKAPVCCGWYEYKYKGKKYKYRFWADNPPEKLTLYFLKNPRKATVEGSLAQTSVRWPVIYAIVTLIMYLITRA